MLFVGYKKEDIERVLGYLETRPFGEVKELVEIIVSKHRALNVNDPQEEEDLSIGLTD